MLSVTELNPRLDGMQPAFAADNKPWHPVASKPLDLHDSPAQIAFERIVKLAARIFDTPIAQINMLESDGLWSKASLGLALSGMPRESAFCTHTLLQPEPMVVANTLEDPRYINAPLVTGEQAIRFYAGVPLLSPARYTVGTLCVMDIRQRDVADKDVQALQHLAGLVEFQLAADEVNRELVSLRQSQQRLDKLSTVRQQAIQLVTHDFRATLSSIMGFAELMRDEEFTLQEMREYSGDIYMLASQLNQMIADLVLTERALLKSDQ